MNLDLTDEQEFLREAARGTLSRTNYVEAAREALDGGELPDAWPIAKEAGWPGLLVSEEHGGAALSPFDAMLVMTEAGRVLAPLPLLGHLVGSWLLDRGGYEGIEAVTMETIFRMIDENVERLRHLLFRAIPEIPPKRSCPCGEAALDPGSLPA